MLRFKDLSVPLQGLIVKFELLSRVWQAFSLGEDLSPCPLYPSHTNFSWSPTQDRVFPVSEPLQAQLAPQVWDLLLLTPPG